MKLSTSSHCTGRQEVDFWYMSEWKDALISGKIPDRSVAMSLIVYYAGRTVSLSYKSGGVAASVIIMNMCGCVIYVHISVMTGAGGCGSPVVQPAGARLCHWPSRTGVASLTHGPLPGGNHALTGPERCTGKEHFFFLWVSFFSFCEAVFFCDSICCWHLLPVRLIHFCTCIKFANCFYCRVSSPSFFFLSLAWQVEWWNDDDNMMRMKIELWWLVCSWTHSTQSDLYLFFSFWFT